MRKKRSYSPFDFTEFSGTIITGNNVNVRNVVENKKLMKLNDSSLTLIGLGPIGVSVLQSLVQAGIGKIRVIDSEVVEKKDLKLGFFTEEEIGKRRCRALQDRFNERIKNTDFQWYSLDIRNMKADSILENSDLISFFSDMNSRLQLNYLNDLCLEHNKDWLTVRFLEDSTEVGPMIIPYKTACYTCYELRLRSVQEAKIMPRDLNEIREQYPNLPAYRLMLIKIIGGFASLEIVKKLTGIEKPITSGNVLTISFKDYSNTLHRILKIPNCPACGI